MLFSSVKFIGFLCLLCFFCGAGGISSSYTEAESTLQAGTFYENRKNRHPEFIPSKELEKRVGFWRLVFTRYGKNHIVFHHRKYPHIIYTVIDFSDDARRLSDKELASLRKKVAKEEVGRIRQALKNLESGARANSPLEKRITQIFSEIPEKNKYKEAHQGKQIRFQSGIAERFKKGIERSGRYIYAIEEIFKQNGLPVELAKLPCVESSFNYKAKSSIGASGIWQFMRSTGRTYMKINSRVDERRDPIIATRAAAKYLANAYNQLEHWPIAVTSYNHGVGGMKRAIKNTGSRNFETIIENYTSKTFGFASKNFFPSFLAALDVYDKREVYFPGIVLDEPIFFDEIKLAANYPFKRLAEYSGMSKKEFANLNPAVLSRVRKGRYYVPKDFNIKVPPGMGRRVINSIGSGTLYSSDGGISYSSKRKGHTRIKGDSHEAHKVRKGETLSGIATKYGVSLKKLSSLNRLRNANSIKVGMVLKLPRGDSSGVASRVDAKHTVKRGESPYLIAGKYSISLYNLLESNGLTRRSKIFPGQQLIIPGGKVVKSEKPSKKVYVVRRGDNLTLIAKRIGGTVSGLRKHNPKLKSRIFPGQRLVYY